MHRIQQESEMQQQAQQQLQELIVRRGEELQKAYFEKSAVAEAVRRAKDSEEQLLKRQQRMRYVRVGGWVVVSSLLLGAVVLFGFL